MNSDAVVHRLTAILSSDAVGYSRLLADDEVAAVRTLQVHREHTARLVRQHRGWVVDSPGDNLLAEFPSALDAVRCAVEIQRAVGARNTDVPPDRRMEFRIGVHLGDVMVKGDRIYGEGINIAALCVVLRVRTRAAYRRLADAMAAPFFEAPPSVGK